MRKFLIAGWLLLPIGAWAYHEGPGQEGVQLDAAESVLAEARDAVAEEDWAAAIEHYEKALEELPELDTAERRASERRIRLSRAKAMLQGAELIEARQELIDMLEEFEGNEEVATELLDETREAYANAQYYYTWLMRVEGYTREDWEPEIEESRQTYRLLAERARDRSLDAKADAYLESLEAAVQLARLDLDELQGLPLPSQ